MNPIDKVSDWVARCGLGSHVPIMLVRVDDANQKSTALVCVEAQEILIKLDSYDASYERHVLHIGTDGKGRMQGISDRELSLSWYESEDAGEVRLEMREKDEDTGDLTELPADIYIVLPLQLLDRKFD